MMCSTSELDRCLKFSQKDNAAGRVSSGDFTDTASVDRGIGLAFESGSIVGFMPGKSLVDECGVDGGYLNDKKSGIDDCIVETDGLYVEKAGSNDENGGLVNSLEDYGASPELMPMSGSLGNSDQLIEQKDEGSGSVQWEMEDKIAGSATETVTCGKMMSSSDCEMPAELISMDALSRNGLEQDMQESIASLEMVMVVIENKSVGLSRIQTDNNNQMCSSLGHGTLSEQITTIGMQSNCFQEEDQKDDKIINTSSADEFTEVMKVSHVIETTTHDQLSSCEDFEKSLEPMPKIGFSEKIIQLDELKDDGSISASSEDFREIGSQPCQPLGFAENGSCKKLDLPNLLGKDVFGAIYSGTATDHSGQTDNERKDCAGNDGPSEIRCPDIGLSLQKSIQKIRTTRAARNGKNKGNVQDLQVFKAERRKRSCFSKPARSSNWGLLGNITQIFEQSNGLEFNEIRNHGLTKTKDGQGSVKQSRTWKNSQAGGSSQKSRGEKHASISGIRLKVKVGKEVPHNGLNIMVPEVIDTSASACGGVSGFESKSYRGTSSEIPNFVNSVEDTALQERTEEQLQCFLNKLEAKVYSDASSSELHVADKDLNGILTSQKSVGDALGDYLGVHSHVDALRGVVEKSHADPGTSPDSEVINVAPEGPVNSRCQEDFLNAVLTSSQDFVAPGLITGINRGKKKDRLTCANDCFPEDISPPMASKNIVKAKKNDKGRQKKVGGFFSNEIHSSPTGANASINSSSSKEFSEVQLHLSKETEHGVSKEDFQVEVSAETKICSGLDDEHVLSESHNSNRLLPSAKYKECQLPRKSAASKGRSKVSDKVKRKRANGYRQKQNEEKSIYENKVKQNNDRNHIICKAENDAETEKCIADDIGKTYHGDNVAFIDIGNLDMASKDVMDQHLPVDNAWVRCDDCHKWRRIPVALVDSIGQTNCEWICKDNMDTAFADCSIPQEKSNAEINAELGLSDADEDAYDIPSKDKGLECMHTIVSKEHEFTCISTNQFLHRSRKTQTIDEIMVCHCKPPLDGGLGCGDECLNRMLNIECVQGTCPCGDLCSNQQFQKRTYARMKWDRCGKKGFGLRLEEDIFKGKFLIEYLGEVLDMRTYEARQREYASKGHKHFYFMTLDGSEVIDACAKGNLGRFINHSCDPNCRTEKWVVNGEICIGLFALRDIKKGEEVTFDYNYVRVVGAAARRCYCGSPNCQGYIGGDPRNTEVIDQVDSDEEFLEPVMLEDGEDGDGFKNRVRRSSSFDGIELQVTDINNIPEVRDTMVKSTTSAGKMEAVPEIEDSVNQSVSVSQFHSSLETDDFNRTFPFANQPIDIPVVANDVTSKSASAVKQVISKEEIERFPPATGLSRSSSDSAVANGKSKSATAEEKRVFVKSRFLIKTSCESSFAKKGKCTSNPSSVNKVRMEVNKSQVLYIKPRKFMDGTSNGRLEAVEEKLNELLDTDGGISKRKDAPKGYLKLLLLTAASGASVNGEAIQSNRDLSMILGALLKTKSRVVLVDIINKNGLRMLHNMIKQYQKDFKKTPILRKLLKVLEYLAVREILTPEHIHGGPPCPGMESFKDSMLSLTEHNDKQVHQIARNFRDKWFPRHSRKYSYTDREDGNKEFHRGLINNKVPTSSQNHLHDLGLRSTEAIDCDTQSKRATSVEIAVQKGYSAPCVVDGMRTRKRKSRWDQPANETTSSKSLQHDDQKIQSGLLQQSEYKPPPGIGNDVLDCMGKQTGEKSYCPHCFRNYCQQDEASCSDNERLNIQSDVPPGFSSPLNLTLVPSNSSLITADLPVGHPQRKFISCLPVSYGIPLPIVQQFGSPQDGTVQNWTVAPGMPFHPFPPLPPLPHHKKETPSSSAINLMVIDKTTEGQWDRLDPAACYPNENNPGTNLNQPDLYVRGENVQHALKRAKGFSHDLGKRYFRQQKWNKGLGPPWIWKSWMGGDA